jgi:hypothetical protein
VTADRKTRRLAVDVRPHHIQAISKTGDVRIEELAGQSHELKIDPLQQLQIELVELRSNRLGLLRVVVQHFNSNSLLIEQIDVMLNVGAVIRTHRRQILGERRLLKVQVVRRMRTAAVIAVLQKRIGPRLIVAEKIAVRNDRCPRSSREFFGSVRELPHRLAAVRTRQQAKLLLLDGDGKSGQHDVPFQEARPQLADRIDDAAQCSRRFHHHVEPHCAQANARRRPSRGIVNQHHRRLAESAQLLFHQAHKLRIGKGVAPRVVYFLPFVRRNVGNRRKQAMCVRH